VEINIGKIYRIDIPSTLDEVGQTKIEELLLEKYSIKSLLINLSNRNFTWEWKTKEGTLPKRIRKFCYKEYNQKIKQEDLSIIGNIASSAKVEKSIYCDFVKVIDGGMWEAGDFGDSGSCYWGGRSEVMGLMEDYKFLAMRIYKENPEENEGESVNLGRCWIYPSTSIINGITAYVFFNGYMTTVNNGAVEFARLFSHLFGNIPYRKITLKNNNVSDGLLYINNSVGYIVAETNYNTINKINSYDFEIDERVYGWETEEQYDYYCGCCEGGINNGDGGGTVINGNDEEFWCEQCINDHASYCSTCGNYYDSYSECFEKVYDESRYWQYMCSKCVESDTQYADGENIYYELDVKLIEINDRWYSEEYAKENNLIKEEQYAKV